MDGKSYNIIKTLLYSVFYYTEEQASAFGKVGAKYGAKFGKKVAQSETGRAAGRAALKAGTDVSKEAFCGTHLWKN